MAEQPSNTARYYPEIFAAADMQRAKEIILTNEGPGANTEARWAIETPYVLELMAPMFQSAIEMVVLDYSCAAGRMAKV
jgi:hypothetical protein